MAVSAPRAPSRKRWFLVVLPTRHGVEIRRPWVERPNAHQAILLQRLGFPLPQSLPLDDL